MAGPHPLFSSFSSASFLAGTFRQAAPHSCAKPTADEEEESRRPSCETVWWRILREGGRTYPAGAHTARHLCEKPLFFIYRVFVSL